MDLFLLRKLMYVVTNKQQEDRALEVEQWTNLSRYGHTEHMNIQLSGLCNIMLWNICKCIAKVYCYFLLLYVFKFTSQGGEPHDSVCFLAFWLSHQICCQCIILSLYFNVTFYILSLYFRMCKTNKLELEPSVTQSWLRLMTSTKE